MKKVFCAPFTAGYYAIPEHEGKRIVKVCCFDTRRTTTNLFGWPIERLYAIVDLRDRKVLSVRDDGVVPIAAGDRNFTEAAAGRLRPPAKPTLLAQPQGPNIQITGRSEERRVGKECSPRRRPPHQSTRTTRPPRARGQGRGRREPASARAS